MNELTLSACYVKVALFSKRLRKISDNIKMFIYKKWMKNIDDEPNNKIVSWTKDDGQNLMNVYEDGCV